MLITFDVLFLHKKDGEEITGTEINNLAIKAYNRFNDLLPIDVESITTGAFTGAHRPIGYACIVNLYNNYDYINLKNLILKDIIKMNNMFS